MAYKGAGKGNIDVDGADDFEDIVDSPYAQGPSGGLLDGEGDDIDGGEREFNIVGEAGSAEDNAFDSAVGALQEIVMSDEFQSTLKNFAAENSHNFTDDEENKLIYTTIFTNYSTLIETFLEQKLIGLIHGFSMQSFLEELANRGESELDPSVYDLLLSLGDFETFKQEMLASGARRTSLVIAGTAAAIHHDEDEDGEIRTDLSDLLLIAPASPSGAKTFAGVC